MGYMLMEETETQAAQPASICPDIEATGDNEMIDLQNDGRNDTRQHVEPYIISVKVKAGL